MKYVLRYEMAPDADFERIVALAPAHRARWSTFQDDGSLLLIGPFADPRDGALAVFTTREAAEAFATGDPFVVSGGVARWTVTAWNEVLLDPI